ncbi:MAG: DoxX family protein [Pseudonocardia sp.]|uniref:DoxX family protein n=1 Tax=unclassified Pseudonocardia TaxID=2619320 RepID=UPI0008697E23|nr:MULTISPECIES: DoxX family protein [unclassified Pseudonocardia]MBN9109501.1 DoxX family protein [Pseudonocardia sp.]ODV08190.1 MAG: DoxX family protein [Pseudonocardia sp. SCN 73-27]
MGVAAWIVQTLLAVAMLGAGGTKLTRNRKDLVSGNMAWAEDFSDNSVKLIGAVEVLGAIGLVLPWALGVLPVLTPIAGAALAAVLLGAVVVHVRRKEWAGIVPPLVLAAMGVFVAVVRFVDLAA